MKLGAIVGGAAGVLTAAAAAGVAQQRRTVERQRRSIDPSSARAFGTLPVDRQSRVQTDDGVGLHTEQVGPLDAPLTVVFVHGFTLNLGSFHFQRLALTDHFGDEVRQVYYDQRSHGRSDHAPEDSCTIEQLGSDLYRVIDALVPDGPVALVGHSMGGMTVMSLASEHQELFVPGGRVVAVALINTSSGDLRNITLGLPRVFARIRGPVVPLVLRRAAKSAALVERGRALGKDLAWVMTKRLSFHDPQVDPAVVAYATNMIAATPVDVVSDFYSALASHDGHLGLMNLTKCPVLVIGADHDALTPLAHSEAIADALPEAELLVVPDSGHLLMMEHPNAVNRPLLSLLDSILAGRAGGAAARAVGRP